MLKPGEDMTMALGKRMGYLHVVAGEIEVANDGKVESLNPGDAVALNQHETMTVTAKSAIEAMWFDLPPSF